MDLDHRAFLTNQDDPSVSMDCIEHGSDSSEEKSRQALDKKSYCWRTGPGTRNDQRETDHKRGVL